MNNGWQVSLTNQSAEPITVTPYAVCTKPNNVPAHALTGYWQNWNLAATAPRQPLGEVTDQFDIIAVAFATPTSNPGEVDFALVSDGIPGYTETDFKRDITEKKAAGKSVILSVGGEGGTLRIDTAEGANNFAHSAYELMQEYGFNGIDIDLENRDFLNSTYLTSALRQLSQLAGPSLVLTMAPQGVDVRSTSEVYMRTALDVEDILTVMNVQLYNLGSEFGCNGQVYEPPSIDFLVGVTCKVIDFGLDPSKVGLGLPATPEAGGDYLPPADVNRALSCLTSHTNCATFVPPAKYPTLRGAMTWSTDWDNKANHLWSNTVGPVVHSLP
ncbi:glycosyl hydrolase family 18 protein [Streptomyces sp. NPDC019539]|uniref:glycosyl hydrolase family 18 protein n=1 Tax=Streptomyces sp. NPDC019539 TaxID=3365063 RepID=UPI0037981382